MSQTKKVSKTAKVVELPPSEGHATHEWIFPGDRWPSLEMKSADGTRIRSCLKCGHIERHDKQNSKCPGVVKVGLRSEKPKNLLSNLPAKSKH